MGLSIVSSNTTSVEFQGREYGIDSRAQERFFQDIPPSLMKIGDGVRSESAILALIDDPTPTKEQIFEAYGEDVKLFQTRHSEFAELLKQAIRHSIVVNASTVDKATKVYIETDAEKIWDDIENGMPAIAKAPTIELSYRRAAKDAPTLLSELKGEVTLGIERLLRTFTYWLQELVEAELIGLVEWTANDVCRYHYFHQKASAEIMSSTITSRESFDGSQPFGDRTSSEEVKTTKVRRLRFLVRHVHHIIGAKLYSLEAYKQKKPARIKQFLNRVPKWLVPCLQIVEGTITMEEQIKLKVADTTTVEEEILATYKYSPGVLLEPFNLIGWSGDDLKDDRKWSEGLGLKLFQALLIGYVIFACFIAGPWKMNELLQALYSWLF